MERLYRHNRSRLRQWAVPVLAALMLGGCSTVPFYAQSIGGHFKLLSARDPVDKLLADKSLDGKSLKRLERAQEARRFATERLALPDNDSYKSYVSLDRPYVLWSLFAAPALSLEPMQWCYPIVGCVPYRGYFSEDAAKKLKAKLERENLDVHISGVAAYSTLGWFADPLTSAMFRHGDAQLAHFIFHELSHQQLYFSGDANFNEAFAEAVAEAGVSLWYQSQNDKDRLEKYRKDLQFKTEFIDLLIATRDRLKALYANAISDGEKFGRKHAILKSLTSKYAGLKERWQGYSDFDRWFDQPVNNARLVAISVYRDDVAAFKHLLKSCDENFPKFYETAKRLEKIPVAERRKILATTECAPNRR